MLKISIDEYAAAVKLLTGLAQQDTSGSRAAAQVLLSAYNGEEWQLDITDLGVLSSEYYEAALAVIRGRTELMNEPHTLIENGEEIFHRIWGRWQAYHVKNRGKGDYLGARNKQMGRQYLVSTSVTFIIELPYPPGKTDEDIKYCDPQGKMSDVIAIDKVVTAAISAHDVFVFGENSDPAKCQNKGHVIYVERFEGQEI